MTGSTNGKSLELSALDGSNPLAFLAALGTLVAVHGSVAETRLRWKPTTGWVPIIEGVSIPNAREFSKIVADALRGRPVSDEDELLRTEAERAFSEAKKEAEVARKSIRKRRLIGEERQSAIENELRPLELDRDQKRREWRDALTSAVPRPELVVGKCIDCTAGEYRECATALLSDAELADREPVDLIANFGSDASVGRSQRIAGTPFCFTTGSGKQYFLDTVRQLIGFVDGERVYQALFEPWQYRDEKLSLRWDPIEARRYALMDRDPTASSNEARTVWMANLLAYRALVLFPSALSAGQLRTTAWAQLEDGLAFTWPIWEAPVDLDTVRSLLQIPELVAIRLDPLVLRGRGISAVFRARRIRIPPTGSQYKVNFSPSRAIFSTSLTGGWRE